MSQFTVPTQRIYDEIAGVTIDLIGGNPPRLRLWRHSDSLINPEQRRDFVFDGEDQHVGSTGTLLEPCPPSEGGMKI